MKKGTLIFAQSGGPTAVINASAAGVIGEAQKCGGYDKILCGRFGIDGILSEDFVDVTHLTEQQLDLLSKTPASAFGSCRHKLPEVKEDPATYKKLLDIFAKYNVTTFVYNGGNDSMDTCNKLAHYCKKVGYPCQVVGVPKTVDNDLAETDHCPGYASAVKYVATTMSEIERDSMAYKKGKIVICEIMGRDSGFLTAGASLARLNGEGPDLIYLPERPFDIDDFVERVMAIYQQKGRCLVAVSEGLRDKNGNYVSEVKVKDSFNHAQLGGVSQYLAGIFFERFGIKTRAIEFSLMQRAGAHIASLTDYNEAKRVGVFAVKQAQKGKTGVMSCLKRMQNNKMRIVAVPLGKVANKVKQLPEEFITPDGTNITDKFFDYVLPLVKGEVKRVYKNGMPVYFSLTDIEK